MNQRFRRIWPSNTALRVVAALAATALPAAAGQACPTCLNIMPTADLMGERTVSLQLEADGRGTPFATGAGLHLLTQAGVTDWCEVGMDVADLNGPTEVYFDAKVLLAAETAARPAIAIGACVIGQPGPPQYYLSLAKQAGDFRTHAGLTKDGMLRGMCGLQWAASEQTTLQADWITGPEAYHSLGVVQDLGGGFSGFVYYARNNTERTEDFMGLNVAWETEF